MIAVDLISPSVLIRSNYVCLISSRPVKNKTITYRIARYFINICSPKVVTLSGLPLNQISVKSLNQTIFQLPITTHPRNLIKETYQTLSPSTSSLNLFTLDKSDSNSANKFSSIFGSFFIRRNWSSITWTSSTKTSTFLAAASTAFCLARRSLSKTVENSFSSSSQLSQNL